MRESPSGYSDFSGVSVVGATGTLVQRVWAWLHETFPERQVFVLSDGRLQFFTFGATLQATLAALGLVFLSWVAFATVNVVFLDRVIAARDQRLIAGRDEYEARTHAWEISLNRRNAQVLQVEDNERAARACLSKPCDAKTLQRIHLALLRLPPRRHVISPQQGDRDVVRPIAQSPSASAIQLPSIDIAGTAAIFAKAFGALVRGIYDPTKNMLDAFFTFVTGNPNKLDDGLAFHYLTEIFRSGMTYVYAGLSTVFWFVARPFYRRRRKAPKQRTAPVNENAPAPAGDSVGRVPKSVGLILPEASCHSLEQTLKRISPNQVSAAEFDAILILRGQLAAYRQAHQLGVVVSYPARDADKTDKAVA